MTVLLVIMICVKLRLKLVVPLQIYMCLSWPLQFIPFQPFIVKIWDLIKMPCYDNSTPCGHHRNGDQEEAPNRAHRSTSQGDHREAANKKITNTKVTEKISKEVHTIHLLKKVIDICTALNEVIVVVDAVVSMVLPVIIGTILIPLGLGIMVKMVKVVVVVVVFLMIHMEWVQKDPNPLSQTEGKDNIDKIDILYRTNSNKVW